MDRTATTAKRVLALYFSQTGQLTSALDAVLQPLRADPAVTVTALPLPLDPVAPFPWPVLDFFDRFPETVLQHTPPSPGLGLPEHNFDLIILAYPVWFLSPPPALTAFLHSAQAIELLRGKPVITLIACRNMWVMAQEAVKVHLQRLQARHLDNIVLTDQSGTLASFITTPRWLFTGRKNAFWGLPAAGVASEDIVAARRFGVALSEALHDDLEQGGQALLTGLAACRVDPRLIGSEKVGLRSFTIWGKLLRRVGQPGTPMRRALLLFYIAFLLCLIVTVVPLSLLIKSLFRPLLKNRLATMQALYEMPSGSATDRMARFTSREVQDC